MSLNRITEIFKGLDVSNKNTTLKMTEQGEFILRSNTSNIEVNKIISNISKNDSIYKSRAGNLKLECQDDNKNLSIKSGKNINNYELFDITNYDTLFKTDDVDTITTFFDHNEIYDTKEKILNLKSQSSLLLESVDNKGIYLYSNNSIHQVAHNDINIISDRNLLFQTSNKLNLTSLGYLIINSEKIISTAEDDIMILSNDGNIKLGGDGLTNYGLNINNKTDKNYISIGKNNEKANRLLHLNINEESYDNSLKNGIVLDNINKNTIFPDIELNHYTLDNNKYNNTGKLNISLGYNDNDKNNRIFIKKNNLIITILNNNIFNENDIGYFIKFKNTEFENIKITKIINEKQAEISGFVTNIDCEDAYILRTNDSIIKTNTESNLLLGTNKYNILNISKNGNIGINNKNPQSVIDIKNNYDIIENIRQETNKKYLDFKGLTLNNTNFVIICKTELDSKINLELFLYNDKKRLLKNIIVKENIGDIVFDIDGLKNFDNNIIISYSYRNSIKFTFTETKIYSSNLEDLNYNIIKQNHQNLDILSFPIIKTFTLNTFNGYVLGYLDKLDGNNTHIYFNIFENKSKNFNNVKKKFNIISKLGDLEQTNSIFTFDKFNFIFNQGTVVDMVLVLTGKVGETNFNSLIKIIISNINQNPDLGELKTIDDSSIKTLGFDIKYLNNNKYIYTYYSVNNNKIINLKYRIYNFSLNTLETENKIDITDYNIPNYNTFSPSISFINTNKDYIISYIIEENSKKNILYFSNKNTDNKIKFDYDNSNNVILLELKNYLNEYTNTLLLFNSIKNDNYEKESILMKEIESVKDFININNNLKITNKGSSIIKNIVIKNDNINSLSDLKKIVGENGEIKIANNELYIYLDNKWKKINLTDV